MGNCSNKVIPDRTKKSSVVSSTHKNEKGLTKNTVVQSLYLGHINQPTYMALLELFELLDRDEDGQLRRNEIKYFLLATQEGFASLDNQRKTLRINEFMETFPRTNETPDGITLQIWMQKSVNVLEQIEDADRRNTIQSQLLHETNTNIEALKTYETTEK